MAANLAELAHEAQALKEELKKERLLKEIARLKAQLEKAFAQLVGYPDLELAPKHTY